MRFRVGDIVRRHKGFTNRRDGIVKHISTTRSHYPVTVEWSSELTLHAKEEHLRLVRRGEGLRPLNEPGYSTQIELYRSIATNIEF